LARPRNFSYQNFQPRRGEKLEKIRKILLQWQTRRIVVDFTTVARPKLAHSHFDENPSSSTEFHFLQETLQSLGWEFRNNGERGCMSAARNRRRTPTGS
jgi:hypothetical protein